jgi:hypothetical protein
MSTFDQYRLAWWSPEIGLHLVLHARITTEVMDIGELVPIASAAEEGE